uniref:NADH-ubiquinone oxidoreductase chain 5 n=1 Tax=Pseudococculinidae sp. MNHN-IM-2013-40847 TaxID=2496598 RepID=A0A6B7FN18_9VEST|nr:NADH dehydrogenase subunit 5 [Pseudococculinidae sp. MNHN-IM-2013-40847]
MSSSLSSLFLFFLSFSMMPLTIYFLFSNKVFLMEWEIISISSTMIKFPLIMDPIGLLFSNTVCLISACVMMFSSSYMSNDIFLPRFIWLVMLFVLSMNLLIFIPNLISLLLGWDGLGIVSFALVIYYSNMKSLAAGMLTALANRLGDVLLLLTIGMMMNQGHWNILSIWQSSMSSLVIFCIILAAMTKSAQIPFSAWLPAAMAAPTPVSALVHSSTLVTAGIFLLIRFYPFISTSQLMMQMLFLISVLTMLMAGISANYEFDLKKIIALSTLSQLGLMMMSISLGYPSLALFHLLTHALFKAMLFLCAGTIIHNNSDTQDIRKLSNLWTQMPLTSSCLNIANLALCGAPFLSGFYSKDLILEMSLFNPTSFFMILLIYLATGMTAAYSIRLSFFSLWNHPNHNPLHQNSDESTMMIFPIMILSSLTIIMGKMIQFTMLEFNFNVTLPFIHKMLVILVIMLGSMAMIFLSLETSNSKSIKKSKFLSFNSSMWFLAAFSTQPIINQPLKMSNKTQKILDQGWLEISSGQGLFSMFLTLTKINQLFQYKFLTLLLTISISSFLMLMFLL